MPKLPPVEKLPLAARKDLRDNWESVKPELQEKLSEMMGTPWTFEVDILQVYAYADDGYAKESYGSYLKEYFEDNIRRLQEYLDYYEKQNVVEEINTICSAHVLVLDVDEENRFTYNGPDVHEGKLRMLFEPKMISTNMGHALDRDALTKALNDAAGSEDKPLSFASRIAIRRDYDPKIEEIRTKIGEYLNKPDIKLTPNFEDTFAKLKEESKDKRTSLDRYWQREIGNLTLGYFDGLRSQLGWQKFEDDDMVQEGFNEVVDKGEISFRIVEKLKKKSYCEFEIEDGVFYIQTTAKNWGSNIDYACENIIDAL